MKRAFKEVLFVRGRGAFKAGMSYAFFDTSGTAGFVDVQYGNGVPHAFVVHRVALAGSIGGTCYKVADGGEESGAVFVVVERCRGKGKKEGEAKCRQVKN